MDLILWRHADAENGAPDLARRLTPKGREQAARVAAWLRARLPERYRLLASPALRAQETAGALNEHFETLKELAPGATVEALLKAAANEGTVVVVGHQPDLGLAIAQLLCGEERDWSVAKGALWWIANRSTVRAVISPDLL
ncbi:MAG TPA: phosphohistidine phosphatase SixA [Burkholderiales bacterium]|nr:phosphohistidine phosphatase SixA [Burkholderiales bacterium]